MDEQQPQSTEGQAEPELLYHYTDQKGLLGIIEHRCLWATHSEFLNDLSEYRIVFDALQRKIKTERKDNWAYMQTGFLSARQMKGIFVSSFSSEQQGDSLAMWRGYSAITGGYSIGFDRLALKAIASALFPSGEKSYVDLGKCIYIDPEELSIGEDIESRVGSAWKESIERMVESASNDLTATFRSLPVNIMEYVRLAALAKHIAFKDENEWRIVIVDEDGSKSRRTKFRHGRSMMVPYLEIPWRENGLPDPIRRVFVGPTPNMDEAAKAVEMLLERNGIPVKAEDYPDGVEVVPSKIPYRNW